MADAWINQRRLELRIPEYEAHRRALWESFAVLDTEAKGLDRDLQASRSKIAMAEATVATCRAELARLEAKREALKELLKERP